MQKGIFLLNPFTNIFHTYKFTVARCDDKLVNFYFLLVVFFLPLEELLPFVMDLPLLDLPLPFADDRPSTF
jgi:hypothetical protein